MPWLVEHSSFINKRVWIFTLPMPLATECTVEDILQSAKAREGIGTFVEKRPPKGGS